MNKRFPADQRPAAVMVCAGLGGDRAGAGGGMREVVADRHLLEQRDRAQPQRRQHRWMTMNVRRRLSRARTM